MARLRVGVLISGRGSNLQALIEAARDPAYPAELVTVVSNVPGAAGLARAADAGILTEVVDHKAFSGRGPFEEALTIVLERAGVELICMAGFMRIVTEGFITRWHDRLINIHPSLLPAFPGLDTHARALAAGVKLAGCTVHYVRAEVDHGPIIGQAAVPVLPQDTPETLAARVLETEHRLFPHCLRLVAQGRVRVAGEATEIADDGRPGPALINPPTP